MTPSETAQDIIEGIIKILDKHVTVYHTINLSITNIGIDFGKTVELLSLDKINTILQFTEAKEYYTEVKEEIVKRFKK